MADAQIPMQPVALVYGLISRSQSQRHSAACVRVHVPHALSCLSPCPCPCPWSRNLRNTAYFTILDVFILHHATTRKHVVVGLDVQTPTTNRSCLTHHLAHNVRIHFSRHAYPPIETNYFSSFWFSGSLRVFGRGPVGHGFGDEVWRQGPKERVVRGVALWHGQEREGWDWGGGGSSTRYRSHF